MNKLEIITTLENAHQLFWDTAISKPSHRFNTSENNKWSIAQNLDHIHISLQKFNRYLLLPKAKITTMFGTSTRPNMDYLALVNAYENTLEKGAVAPAPFVPVNNKVYLVDELIAEGHTALKALCLAIEGWEEEDLDTFNCPHPLLGSLTAREMCYFNIYHVQHHQNTILNL